MTFRLAAQLVMSSVFMSVVSIHAQQASGEATFTAAAKGIKTVYRVAPSIATGVEARKAMARFGWQESQAPMRADAILVAVKTFGLHYPLNDSYATIEDIVKDADGQMNISGGLVHLYLFVAGSHGLIQLAHMTYEDRSWK